MGKHYDFQILDHTADVGILARGRDLKQAFAASAYAMFTIMADLERVEEAEMREVTVRAETRDSLLVNWLSELLYFSEVEGLLFKRFDIQELTETALRARVYGERRDPARHELKLLIKGITYHMLEVAEGPAGARLQVILDI